MARPKKTETEKNKKSDDKRAKMEEAKKAKEEQRAKDEDGNERAGSFDINKGFRAWIFVIYHTYYVNNPTLLLDQCEKNKSAIRYCSFQVEKCPTTGKLHVQGFIALKTQQKFTRLHNIFPYGDAKSNFHCMPRYALSTDENAAAYTHKVETRVSGPWEWGTLVGGQGNRTDLQWLHDSIKEGKTDLELLETSPDAYCRNIKGIDRMRALYMEQEGNKMRDNITCEVIYGWAGGGKSTGVYNKHNANEIYKHTIVNEKDMWYNGYNGQKVLLIDDFYGEGMKYTNFLHVLDRLPLRLPVKNSFAYALWDKVYITSNKHPEEWFPEGLTDALKRRINRITQVLPGGERVITHDDGKITDAPMPAYYPNGKPAADPILAEIESLVTEEPKSLVSDLVQFQESKCSKVILGTSILDVPGLEHLDDNIDTEVSEVKGITKSETTCLPVQKHEEEIYSRETNLPASKLARKRQKMIRKRIPAGISSRILKHEDHLPVPLCL